MGTAAQAGGLRLGKKLPKKIVRKEWIIRSVRNLNVNRSRVRFEKVSELVNADVPDLCKTFNDGVPKLRDAMYEKKSRRNRKVMGLWNE